MTTKQYLEQADMLDKKVNNKLAELYRLRCLSTSISATFSDDVRIQTSRSGGKLEKTVAKIVDLEQEIDSLVDNYLDYEREIIGRIEAVGDSRAYDVLFKRYIETKTFAEISMEMGYSRKQINRIHGEALCLFEEKYGNFYKNIKYVP